MTLNLPRLRCYTKFAFCAMVGKTRNRINPFDSPFDSPGRSPEYARVDTERRFVPRFKNRGLAPSNVSTIMYNFIYRRVQK